MKRGYIIGIVIIVAVASLGTYAGIKHFSKEKSASVTSKITNLNQTNSMITNIKSVLLQI